MNSSDTTLNSSFARLGMIHQGLVAAAISNKREPLADQVVHNVPEKGTTIAGQSHEGGLAIHQGGVQLVPADSP